MSGNKTLYTTAKCRSMTEYTEFVNELLNRVEKFSVEGYFVIYPKHNVITGIEMKILAENKYEIVSAHIHDNKLRIFLYKGD